MAIYCSRCGKQQPDDTANFCQQCGMPFKDTPLNAEPFEYKVIEIVFSIPYIECARGFAFIGSSFWDWEKADENEKAARKLARQRVDNSYEIKSLSAAGWRIDEGWLPDGRYKEGIDFHFRHVGILIDKYRITKANVRLRRARLN